MGRRLALRGTLLVALLLVAACSPEPPTLEVVEGALPDGFPADFPLPDDAEVESGVVSERDGATVHAVTVRTAQDRDELLAWYADELDAGGWRVTQRLDGERDGRLTATLVFTGNDEQGMVAIAETPDVTTVTITLTPDRRR